MTDLKKKNTFRQIFQLIESVII